MYKHTPVAGIKHWYYAGKKDTQFNPPHLVNKNGVGAVCGATITYNYEVREYAEPHKWLCKKCKSILAGNGRGNNAHENSFGAAMIFADIPEPVREYRFALPKHQYRLDFAWPDKKLAVEVDGVHHDTIEQQDIDRKKRNVAVLLGWRVLTFSYRQIFSNEDDCIEIVRQALKA